MLLRARLVLPVSGPPISDGAVLTARNRIVALGRWRDLAPQSRSRAVDLGESVMLPGLINAHCHLDYTHMAGHFAPPKLFIDWLKVITDTKAGWSLGDYNESWLSGAQMLLRTGTTTVADIEAVPQLLPKMWAATPLRVISFLELIGITSRRLPGPVLQEALDKIPSLRDRRCRVGLSPHAPYSTVPELLRLAGAAARRGRMLLCIHLAESALELAMFARAEGEMFTWLERSGRDMSDCGHGSPTQHLERCGLLGPNLLAVHANYLARNDAALLGRHRVAVAHCPRSHAYFRHEPFRWRLLARAGVNLCLGTDSLASVCKNGRQPLELNMFEEMRALAGREPGLSPRAILRMATLNGARALRLPGQLGELAPGALADLIVVPYAGKTRGVHEAMVQHKGDVAASMLNGKWVYPATPVVSAQRET